MSLDPITLQVMANALRAVAEEMEAALVRTAHRPNIKERRDCSTAIFDDGRRAWWCSPPPSRCTSARCPRRSRRFAPAAPAPGEVWLVNDPYRGGTHLPDLTMISAVALDGRAAAYAVTRAHHADVGGMAPGSMPAGSRELLQEGIVIPPVRIVRDGRPVEDVVALLLANTRTPTEREGDLRAQLAAHRLGSSGASGRSPTVIGAARVRAAFAALFDYAERRTRAAIAAMPDGTRTRRPKPWRATATPSCRVAVTIAGDHDGRFRRDRPTAPGNRNCPPAVTRSAGLFVLRVPDRPRHPRLGGRLRPRHGARAAGEPGGRRAPAAVAGGNVETSSRRRGLRALGRRPGPAQGQGTMNNLTIGGAGFTYYETIGGGQGASPGADGPSGVHVAMSNTLNTPVEALEVAYPLTVELPSAARLGRGGRTPGGRRGRAARAGAGADDLADRRAAGVRPGRGARGGVRRAPGRDPQRRALPPSGGPAAARRR